MIVGNGDTVFKKQRSFLEATACNARLYVTNFIKEEYQSTLQA